MKYFRSLSTSFLLTTSDENGWSFTLIDSAQSWKGILGNEDIARNALEVHQSASDYTKTMKSIFSAQTEELSLELEQKSEHIKEMSWKKITSSGAKFSLGTVTLKRSKSSCFDEVLCSISVLIADLNKNLDLSKQQLNESKAFNQGLSDKLEMLGNLKVQLEGELFTKFVSILNEKKAKIRSLKNEIAQLKNEHDTKSDDNEINISASSGRGDVKIRSITPEIPDFEEDQLDTAFISKIPKQNVRKRGRNLKPSSSKSRKQYSPPVCDKILADDDTLDADELIENL